MKVNIVLTTISVLISCILTYLVYSLCHEGEEYKVLLCACSFLSFASTLSVAIGISFLNTRANVNIKITSVICAFVLLLTYIGFAIAGVNMNALIIVTSFILLVYLLLIYILPQKGV